MTKTIIVGEERHYFPDEATDADIATALSGHTGRKVSQTDAAALGLASGLSAGFADELVGGHAAFRTPKAAETLGEQASRYLNVAERAFPPLQAAEAGMGIGQMLGEKITGQRGEATTEYEKARDDYRAQEKAAEEQYPKTHLAGEIAGSLALPAGSAARAATLPVRALRAAKTGAAIGALSGAGHGEGVAGTGVGSIIGAGTGAVLGPAGTAVAEGAAKVIAPVVPAISRLAGRVVAPVRAAFDPRTEAERMVAGTIEEGIAADPKMLSRVGPIEMQRAQAAGIPVIAADVGGAPTRRLADTASIMSREGGAELTGLLKARADERRYRLSDWLRETHNYPEAAAQQDAIDAAARTANKAGYTRAEMEAAKLHPGGLWDESFEQLSQDPTVQAAIRKANITSRSAAARQGVSEGQPITPLKSPFTMDANGRMVLRDPQARPTLRFWDEVKKNLDKTGSFESRSMAQALREHVDSLVPSYQAARAGAAHFFGAENALEAGQNFVGASRKYALPEARKALAKMSPTERQLFQDGYVSRLINEIEAKGDKRTVLNDIAVSRPAQEEIRMVLGQQRANELEARLRIEGLMDLTHNAVSGNSWSARRLFDIGLGSVGIGGVGWGSAELDPKKATVGALMAALAGGRAKVNANVMRHVAELLASSDLTKLAKGANIVAGNSKFLDALRATDRRIAAAGGEQAPNLPAVQAGGVSAAQPDQNQVPRPPGQ